MTGGGQAVPRGTVSLSVLAPELGPRYSGRVAPGFAVFLSLRPSRHAM